MAIHIKSNADAGAPVLSSTAGAMIAVLDWFLVTELGWTKAFSNSTTGGAYRAPTGNRFYYQFSHTLTYMSEIRSFETMSAWNTGTGGTTAATVYHANWNTTAADTTPVPYTLISDGTFVIVITYTGGASNGYGLVTFGDIISYLPTDNFASIVSGTSTYSSPQYGHANDTATQNYKRIVRAADQSTPQANVALSTSNAVIQTYIGGSDVLYPNEITGGLVLFPILVIEGSPTVIRGRLPGILSPCRVSSLLPGTTFNGTGDLAGRTYKIFQLGGSSYAGRVAIETSDTWRT